MDKRRAMKIIALAQAEAEEEISGLASRGGRFAAGLSSEGYAGGYRDALSDVLLLLSAGIPGGQRNYFRKAFAKAAKRPNQQEGQ